MIDDIQALKVLVSSIILPSVCIIGLVTNSINFVIFAERRRIGLRNRRHQYFQRDSLAEFFYLLACLGYFVLKTKVLANFHFTFFTAIYEKYVYMYFASVLACFMLFLRLYISIRRLLIILNTGIYLQTIRFYKTQL